MKTLRLALIYPSAYIKLAPVILKADKLKNH